MRSPLKAIARICTRIPVIVKLFLATAKPNKHRIALIEYAPGYHDECLPTWVVILNRLGYGVDIYLKRANLNKKLFEYLPKSHLDYTITLLPSAPGTDGCGKFFDTIERLWCYRNYRAVVFNSLLSHHAALFADAKWSRPTLCVLHNPQSALQAADYQQFFKNIPALPLVLNEHIATNLTSFQNYQWLLPAHALLPNLASADKKNLLSVQGNVDFHRRHYHALLPLASQLPDSWSIQLVGNILNEDGPTLHRAIQDADLIDKFILYDTSLEYAQYYTCIAQSRFLLVLIDQSLLPSYQHKATSSIATALITQTIPIMLRQMASWMHLEDIAITYDNDDDFIACLHRAMSLSSKEREAYQAKLFAYREEALNQSQANVARCLTDLGVPISSK
jgi:hypothetical protein